MKKMIKKEKKIIKMKLEKNKRKNLVLIGNQLVKMKSKLFLVFVLLWVW